MPEEQVAVEEEVQQEVVEDVVEEVVKETPSEILEEEPVIDMSPPDPEPEAKVEDETGFRTDQYTTGSQLGFSPEQVDAFGTPENFDRMLGAMQHNAQQQHYQQQQQQQQYQQQQYQQQQPGPVGNFQFQNPDDFDEGIVGMNNHMNYRMMQMESMIGAMHQQSGAMQQQNERLQAEAIGRSLESTLDGMDEELFGRGPLDSLSGDQAKNRIAVANEFARAGTGYMQQGLEAPSIPELAKHAANALFADNFKDKALKEASEQTRDVASQASARPTQQEESPGSGTEAAIRAAAEWHREHGTNAHDAFG